MSSITVNVYVDLNNDGDYVDANEDISAYVITAVWGNGFAKAYDLIARDSTCTLRLKNTDKRFSPESGSALSGFTRGRKIKITTTFSATTRTMYVGWIRDIQPEPDTRGKRVTIVQCEGVIARWQDVESFVPIQESVTADVVLAAILDGCGQYPPGMVNRWLLGVVGYSEVGTNTALGATTDYLTAETGKTTFTFIGDKWGSGVSVLSAIRDTLSREFLGRLYVKRDGTLQFWNRHHFISDTMNDETFTNTMVGMEYSYGSEVINRVTVRYRPRIIGAAPETLGILNTTTLVDPGTSKAVTIRFVDNSTSAKVGGRDLIAPIANNDFTANTLADGTGTDYTTSISAVVTKATANSATITYTNSAIVPLYVQSGARIRGTKLTDFGESEYIYEDTTSRGSYGLHDYVHGSALETESDARYAGEYLISLRKDPRGQIESVEIAARANDTLATAAAARVIGDRITITETQTGTSAAYFIIGEKHMIKPGDYRVLWTLEPASGYKAWLLGTTGYGELGQQTYLGPL